MRKIIVEPTFMEAHFLDAHIRNICDYIYPNIFIFIEGCFPKGPESTTQNMNEFKTHYTLNGYRGFDYEQVKKIIFENSQRYPNTSFLLIETNYDINMETADAYYYAFTEWLKYVDVGPDDLIFPLETDLFFTAAQADLALSLAVRLSPDEGIGSSYISYFESPQVVFPWSGERIRKLAIRYGSGGLWHKLFKVFFWENKYKHMLKNYNLKLHHYEWIRPGKYFDARVAQLNRDEKFWQCVKEARMLIQEHPEGWKECISESDVFPLEWKAITKEVHPPHIYGHENWERYYGNDD